MAYYIQIGRQDVPFALIDAETYDSDTGVYSDTLLEVLADGTATLAGTLHVTGNLSGGTLDVPDDVSDGFHVDAGGNVYMPFFDDWRIQLNDPLYPFLWWDGAERRVSFELDTGNVFIGRLLWGSTSAFVNDYWESPVQPSGGGYLTPDIVQSNKGGNESLAHGGSISVAWPNPTVAGNTLIVGVVSDETAFIQSSFGNQTHSTPAGYTLIGAEQFGDGLKLSVYRKENCSAGESAPSVSVVPPAAYTSKAWMVIAEVENVATASFDVSQSATGSTSHPYLGPSSFGLTTQSIEMWLAIVGTQEGPLVGPEAGFTEEEQENSSSGIDALGLYSKNVTATGNLTFGITSSGGVGRWVMKVLGLKAKAQGTFPAPASGYGRAYWSDVGAGVAHLFTKGSDGVAHDLTSATPNAILADILAPANSKVLGASGHVPDASHVHPFALVPNYRHIPAHTGALDGGTVVTVGTYPDGYPAVRLIDGSTQGVSFIVPLTDLAFQGGSQTIQLKLIWSPSATDSNAAHAVRWSVNAKVLDPTSSTTDSTAAGTTTVFTGSTPAGGHTANGIYRDVNNTYTDILSFGGNVGTLMRLDVRRLGGDGADTYAGDVRLVAVEVNIQNWEV